MARPSAATREAFRSEVVFAADVPSATLTRAVRRGEIRSLARGLYSTNLADAPESIVFRNRWRIAARLFPGAVVADRSALPRAQEPSALFLSWRGPRRDLELPGLLIRARTGPGPIEGDHPIGADGLHFASLARALVENTRETRSRLGRPPATVRRDVLEEVIADIELREGADALSGLRGGVLAAGEALDMTDGAELVCQVIDALTDAAGPGEGPARPDVAHAHAPYVPASRVMRARLSGYPFDRDAVARFDLLRDEVARLGPTVRPAAPLGELPFFEAYFSNFIEGTEFSVEDARRIITRGWEPEGRPEDAHDVRCTFTIVSDLEEMRRVPGSADEFLALLRERHRVLMASRPDTHPGRFKTRNNRAGGTEFVDHRLVNGTLREGYARLAGLADPFQRAVLVMFVVAEVHPFDDGNGRIARVFMNAELAAGDRQRIIIPPIYRDDYLGGLRALSRRQDPAPLPRVLAFAQNVASRVEWSDYDHALAQLRDANALLTEDEAEEQGRRLRLPHHH